MAVVQRSDLSCDRVPQFRHLSADAERANNLFLLLIGDGDEIEIIVAGVAVNPRHVPVVAGEVGRATESFERRAIAAVTAADGFSGTETIR